MHGQRIGSHCLFCFVQTAAIVEYKGCMPKMNKGLILIGSRGCGQIDYISASARLVLLTRWSKVRKQMEGERIG